MSGSHIDGILSYETGIELGAIEAAPKDQLSGVSNKWLSDHFKLARLLQTMYRSLEYRYGEHAIRDAQIQVIGTVEQGQDWEIYGLQRKGSIYYLQRHFKTTLYTSKRGLNTFLNALKETARIRTLLDEMITKLNHLPYQASIKKRKMPDPMQWMPQKELQAQKRQKKGSEY